VKWPLMAAAFNRTIPKEFTMLDYIREDLEYKVFTFSLCCCFVSIIPDSHTHSLPKCHTNINNL
jgi:hypothetical protein